MSGPRPWNGADFRGAKIALITGDRILTYLRDDIPGIPFPNRWDLPGGGREGDESPLDCALRETHEEFGLTIDPASVIWHRAYPGAAPADPETHFFVAPLTPERLRQIRFGDEGQRWATMSLTEFLDHPAAVPHLQARLRDWLDAR